MRIFLIGMPGSGKTTLGRKLAEEFGFPFIDLDNEIETREGEVIASIFDKKGEGHFRKAEAATLREVASSVDRAIIASGGGTPCFQGNLNFMKKNGHVIYFQVPIDTLLERLEKEKERPLLKVKKDLRVLLGELMEKRRAYYEQADFIVGDYEELVLRLKSIKAE